jgi:NADPH:quinone reductase-like Zn-dependent oxidoreductase
MDQTMHALRIHHRGGPEGLVYEQAPVPSPDIGDVLLRVAGASLTPTELAWPSTWVDRRGLDRSPVIPCHEVSGVVVQLGDGTSGFELGDELFGITDWYRDGTAAEFVAVEARNLAHRPTGCGAVEAASIPLPGLTAWQALVEHGRLGSGASVLITGATGGVGAVAVQLARDLGATVIAAGHAQQAAAAADLGAKEFVDVDSGRWLKDAGHVDLVFDLVGGDLLDQVVHVGLSDRVVSIVEPREGVVYFVVEPDRLTLAELARRVDAGSLRPIVSQTIPLSNGRQAFEAGHGGGKRVLVPEPGAATSH